MPSRFSNAESAAAPERPSRRRALARFDAGFALAEVTRLMRAAYDARMRSIGLTGATLRVVTYLAREDGQTQASLARSLDISRVALGEAVDRLEKSGHVERRADASDRRKWRVHLTAKSRAMLPQMFDSAGDLQEECFRDLSDADLARLQSIVARLRARLLGMRLEDAEEASEMNLCP